MAVPHSESEDNAPSDDGGGKEEPESVAWSSRPPQLDVGGEGGHMFGKVLFTTIDMGLIQSPPLIGWSESDDIIVNPTCEFAAAR